MYNIDNEDKKVFESIQLKSNSVSEKIKEAIIEMNIMKQKKISLDTLMKFIYTDK